MREVFLETIIFWNVIVNTNWFKDEKLKTFYIAETAPDVICSPGSVLSGGG